MPAAKSWQSAHRFNTRAGAIASRFRRAGVAKAAEKTGEQPEAAEQSEENSSDEYPAELSAIMVADPTVDPATYWIEGQGWDMDGIISDSALYVAQPKAHAKNPQQSSTPQKGGKGSSKKGNTKATPGSTLRQGSTETLGKGKSSEREDGEVNEDGQGKDSKWKGGKGKKGRGKHGNPGKGRGKAAQRRDTDNEGRPYDFSRVVVNFVNVGTYYGRKTHDTGKFHWEGVRRCVRYLVEEQRLKVIGVIFENWHGLDDTPGGTVSIFGIPQDIRDMCEQIEETPKIAHNYQEWSKHKSADDEMTIKLAHRRNCRLLDNDNYRDWIQNLKSRPVREWLQHCQDRLQMKYYFDSGLGCFETLDGNDERDSGDEHGQVHSTRSEGGVPILGKHPEPPKVVSLPSAPAVSLPSAPAVSLPSAPAARVGVAVNSLPSVRSVDIPFAPAVVSPRVRLPMTLPTDTNLRPEGPMRTAPAPVSKFPLGYTSVPQPAVLPHLQPSVELQPLEEGPPLFEAVHQGHLGQLKALLRAGQDPNLPDAQGVNVIYYAVFNRDLEAVRLLKKYCASIRRAIGPQGEPLESVAYRWLKEEGPETLSREMLAELRIPADAALLHARVPLVPPRSPQAITIDDDENTTSASSQAGTAAAGSSSSRKRQRTSVEPEVVAIDDDLPADRPQTPSKESDAQRKDRLLKLNSKVRAVQAEAARHSGNTGLAGSAADTMMPSSAEAVVSPQVSKKRKLRELDSALPTNTLVASPEDNVQGEAVVQADSESTLLGGELPTETQRASGPGFMVAEYDPYMVGV